MPWSFWTGYLEKLAIVGLVLAALFFVGRRLRKTRLFSDSGRFINVVESLSLSQHAAVYLVRVGSRYFLIGSATAGICALAELAECDMAQATR